MPKQYSAEIVYGDGERMVLYVDGLMQRLEVYPKTGQPKIWLQRPDKGVEWSLSTRTCIYSEEMP